MIFTGRVADKLMFVAIYLAASVLVVWGAGRITNYAQDARFYRTYLKPWEMRLLALRYKPVEWPVYIESNPATYMQAVTRVMQVNGVQPPESNTDFGYTYRLQKFGDEVHQILLVFRDNHLVIYGLPRITFDRLDRFIDGSSDPDRGNFTGRWSTDRVTRIGYLKF